MTRHHFILSALMLATSTLAACAVGSESESEFEDVGTARQGAGGTGNNDLSPVPVDQGVLKRSVLNGVGITSSTNPDPLPLCEGGTITSTGCTMKAEWEDWLNDDLTNRPSMMHAITKCSVESSFSVTTSGGQSFAGQWPFYTSWKSSRLNSQEKRERVSACILTLLNGNNVSLALCIIGPGGSPFSDACDDTSISTREAGFFGDLFASTPKAYVVGPQTATMLDTGRACTSDGTSYCCAESNNTCPHHIYRAGAMLGSESRCDSFATVTHGSTSYTYCTSFWTSREPGKSYTNGFTTFVP
jgi:hypothetical protein